jgi:hypothetical protein
MIPSQITVSMFDSAFLKNARFLLVYEAQENPEEDGPQAEDNEDPFPDPPLDLEKADKTRMTFSPLQFGQQTTSSLKFQISFSKSVEQSAHRYS